MSGWEHGRGQPDADMLFLLCDIYEIKSIAEFYSDEHSASHTTLLPDEAELLSFYRSMNKEGKAMLMNTARVFAGNPEMQEGLTKQKEIS